MDAVVTHKEPSTGSYYAWKNRWLIPCALALGCLVSLSIDISAARVFDGKQLPATFDRTLREALEICETFGHGFGAVLIAIAVVVLDPLKRRIWPWLLAGSIGSGTVANALKYCVPRTRPRDFDLTAGTVWDTFVKGSQTGWGMQSFPSAHTATAVGLAVTLSAMYPRGSWYFAVLAVFVGFQRIVSSAHFPSDVFAGAVVGWLVGTVCASSMISPRTAQLRADVES